LEFNTFGLSAVSESSPFGDYVAHCGNPCVILRGAGRYAAVARRAGSVRDAQR